MFEKFWKAIFLSNNNVFLFRVVKMTLSVIDRTNKHKISRIQKNLEDLNNTINQPDLTDIYKYSTHQQQNIHYFQ